MSSSINSAFSLSIVNHFNQASRRIGDSLKHLSSGKRILSAQDGAADLARITALSSEIRGVRQAVLNVNEGGALANEADAALGALLTIAYNIRELSQQASDSSLTSEERDLLSEEAADLITDFTNIVDNTEYNGSNLLDNSFVSQWVQSGPAVDHGFYFSIGDARASTLGKLAVYSGAQGAISAALSGQLTLNGTTVASSTSDGLSTNGEAYSALAIATAISSSSLETNVYAEALATTRTLKTDFAGAALYSGTISSNEFKINDVSITGTISSASSLVTAINAASDSTGISATLSGTDVILEASDGRNIEFYFSLATTNNVYDVFNLSTNYTVLTNYSTLSAGNNTTHVGAVRMWSSEAITVAGTSVSNAIGLASGSYSLVADTDMASIDLSTEDGADAAIRTLDATIAQISSLRSEVGAIHSRLDASGNYLIESEIALSDAKSVLEDVDFVMETANLVSAQLLQDSALSALTQANISSAKVLKLLEGF